jgi:hypothetical protein
MPNGFTNLASYRYHPVDENRIISVYTFKPSRHRVTGCERPVRILLPKLWFEALGFTLTKTILILGVDPPDGPRMTPRLVVSAGGGGGLVFVLTGNRPNGQE